MAWAIVLPNGLAHSGLKAVILLVTANMSALAAGGEGIWLHCAGYAVKSSGNWGYATNITIAKNGSWLIPASGRKVKPDFQLNGVWSYTDTVDGKKIHHLIDVSIFILSLLSPLSPG